MIRTNKRRLTFQLTPLLDLLLIVIFAQYLEVRETSREEIADAADDAERLEQLEAEHDRLVARAGESDRLENENESLRRRLEGESVQRERLAKRFAEIFRVNERMMAAALDPEDPRFEGLSPEDLERLRKRLDELVEGGGGAALEHLVTYEELRKRADVWKVRIGNVDEGGRVSITAGERTATSRPATPEAFATWIAEFRNSLDQPKDHVIILLTYESRSAELRAKNTVRDGLSRFVTRARSDGGPQFFWAEIGYDPRVLGLPN